MRSPFRAFSGNSLPRHIRLRFNDEGLMNASDRRQRAHHNGLLNPKELAKSTTFKRQSQENTIIPEVSKSPDAFNTEKPSNAMTPKCKFSSYGKTE
ncbi:hypothetical protein FOXYSP1_07509 [Fusarium oxysporum f. sp. phaseoli]